MKIEIEDYEYDCMGYCTSDGCRGHTTDIPVAIIINNIRFEVEGYSGGDYPSDQDTINDVKKVVDQIVEKLIGIG